MLIILVLPTKPVHYSGTVQKKKGQGHCDTKLDDNVADDRNVPTERGEKKH